MNGITVRIEKLEKYFNAVIPEPRFSLFYSRFPFRKLNFIAKLRYNGYYLRVRKINRIYHLVESNRSLTVVEEQTVLRGQHVATIC